MRIIFSLLFLFVCATVFSQKRILFVGNSLTYANNLPALVERIAKADGVAIATEVIAFPDYALEDHWNEKNVAWALRKKRFDFAIFQQGPSALPASRENLIAFTLKFASLCKSRKVQMGMYMVWPSAGREFDFQNVIQSYSISADTSKCILLPAGAAWKKILDQQKDFPLYSSDGFHPSIQGSVLSALTIYAALFGKDNLDFVTEETVSPSRKITADQLAVMKAAALDVLRYR